MKETKTKCDYCKNEAKRFISLNDATVKCEVSAGTTGTITGHHNLIIQNKDFCGIGCLGSWIESQKVRGYNLKIHCP